MPVSFSRMLASRLHGVIVDDLTRNRGWEGSVVPLRNRSNVPTFTRSTAPGRTPRILVLVVLSTVSPVRAGAASQPRSGSSTQQQSATCPMHQSQQTASCLMHEQHQSGPRNLADQVKLQSQEPAHSDRQGPGQHDHDAMNQRGNTGMGFDQEKTTHHFRLLPEGGAIEVESNDATDTKSRDQVKAHLRHIAQRFSVGDFSIPMLVHDHTPDGVETMKQLREAISYEYEEMEHGARVKISTSDPRALEAIHDFLRFQIREHETGDSVEVGKP